MGVDLTHYIFYGSNVGAENFDWDKWDKEMNGHPEAIFDIVYDGMMGDYCYAGKIIAQLDRYSEITGKNPISLSDKIYKAPEGICGLVSSHFPNASGFGFYFFTHYS